MKNVMTRAWEIAKGAAIKFGGKAVEYISGALKMAWEEIKNTPSVEKAIAKLMQSKKVSEWKNYGHHRFYLNDYIYDLLPDFKVSIRKSGTVSFASWKGEKMTNGDATSLVRGLKSAYFDVKTGTLFAFGDRPEMEAQVLENLYA